MYSSNQLFNLFSDTYKRIQNDQVLPYKIVSIYTIGLLRLLQVYVAEVFELVWHAVLSAEIKKIIEIKIFAFSLVFLTPIQNIQQPTPITMFFAGAIFHNFGFCRFIDKINSYRYSSGRKSPHYNCSLYCFSFILYMFYLAMFVFAVYATKYRHSYTS